MSVVSESLHKFVDTDVEQTPEWKSLRDCAAKLEDQIKQMVVGQKIIQATQEANSGNWEKAQEILANTNDIIPSTTSLTQQWKALTAKLATQINRVADHFGRIADQKVRIRAVAEAKEKAETEQQGQRPAMSSWDGSCIACEKWLKPRLNDDESYQHVSTTPNGECCVGGNCSDNAGMSGCYWRVNMTYRAKNSFGAKILDCKAFYFQYNTLAKTGKCS